MHLEPLALRLFLRHGVEISNAFRDPKKVEEEENSEPEEEEEDEQERERERERAMPVMFRRLPLASATAVKRVYIHTYTPARVRSLRYYSRVRIGRAASPAAAA